MNRYIELLVLISILASAIVIIYTLFKVGLNTYSGKIIAISLIIITINYHILLMEEKKKMEVILLILITIFTVIFSLIYLSLIFSIPISIVLAILLFFHIHKEIKISRTMLVLPILLTIGYLISFLTKPIILTGTTGYAIIHQSLLPRATITSISGNTVTFRQVDYVKARSVRKPNTIDCVINSNKDVFCFSFLGRKYGKYFIQGQLYIGNSTPKTCFIILYQNNTFKTNCPYVKSVSYIKFYNTGCSTWPRYEWLEYSLTFNQSGFKKLINYKISVLKCNGFSNGTYQINQLGIVLSAWPSKEYYIDWFNITYGNKLIYHFKLKDRITKYCSKVINTNIIGTSRVICMYVKLVPWHPTKKPIYLNICEPLPITCINYTYLKMISKKLHTYFTPYNVSAKINISKIELPNIYINITFTKNSYGRKVGLVIYNNNNSSPTLQIKLSGTCKGNVCYETIKEPIPSINKTNNIRVKLIGGPKSRIISQVHMTYNPIEKVMKAKNMTTTEKKKMINKTMSKIKHMKQMYKPMYKNIAPPLEKEEKDEKIVSNGCKILLGISMVVMIGIIFLI